MAQQWFKDARFGMFIHWGAYSVAARGEWVLNREHIPYDEYIEKYVNQFQAENFDPVRWAKLAKQAGMKYVVLTAKHHDGFCLWDTKTTDFNSVCMGPKKDLVKEYVEAVRNEGLKVGIYFSPADWHHPDYPNAYCRDWPDNWTDEEARKRFVEFYTEQIRELVTNYGKIDVFWYDGCIPKPLDGEKVNQMIYEYQPDITINARNGEPCDYYCCEQTIQAPKKDVMWEACMTLNDNWGYHSGDKDFKSPRDVVKMLLKVAEGGGNLLLNVGPMADGTIPEESVRILEKVGAWLKDNGDAIYRSVKSPFSWAKAFMITTDGEKVYITMYHKLPELTFVEIKNKVKRIYQLNNAKEMRFEQKPDGRLTIYDIDIEKEDELAITFACEIEGAPEAITTRTSFWIPGYEV